MVTIALAWIYMSAVYFAFGWATIGLVQPGRTHCGRYCPGASDTAAMARKDETHGGHEGIEPAAGALLRTGACLRGAPAEIIAEVGDRLPFHTAVPLSVLPLIGLAEIAVVTGDLSLAMPIGRVANGFILATACGLIWVGRARLRSLRADSARACVRGWGHAAVVGLVFVLLAIKSAIVVEGTLTKVFHSDTAYYHAPSIRWIAEYGVVPGLGNLGLHGVLGFLLRAGGGCGRGCRVGPSAPRAICFAPCCCFRC